MSYRITGETSGLWNLLCPSRPLEILDAGANPVDETPPYADLVRHCPTRVTGFEPDPATFANLTPFQSDARRDLPLALGDGGRHTLHVCWGDGMASLLEPDPARLRLFNLFARFGEVTGTMEVQTHRLDDVAEIDHLDFVKADVQGSELAIFENGRTKLREAVAVHTEVSFIPLYRDQPTFADIDDELRGQGFVPHHFAEIKRWPISPTIVFDEPRLGLNQLLEADLVYVRDFRDLDALTADQIKFLACIAHHGYGSHDLTLRCIVELERRREVGPTTHDWYVRRMNAQAPPQPDFLP